MKFFTTRFGLLATLLLLHFSLIAQPEITPQLQAYLSKKNPSPEAGHEFIPLNIRLSAQYDHEQLYAAATSQKNREARRQFVVESLRSFAQEHQQSLLNLLKTLEAEGMVKDIRPLWIGNFVHARVHPDVIDQLSQRLDLARLDLDVMRQLITAGPLEKDWSEISEGLVNSAGKLEKDGIKTPNIAWSVSMIGAPEVWESGFTGEEVIVAVLDSGVNYNHQDLQANMWTHPDFPNHGFNFLNNSHSTMDDNSHGTHCAGTVAGNGTAGTITGIAPNAKIMALKVLSGSGSGSESGVWAAIEFSVEYGAHIMSLSLGWKHAWSPDRAMWRTTMNNALSAGVIAAVAAGNEGNSWTDNPPSEVRTPGDVPPPWLHPDQTQTGGTSAVVSVGSVTQAGSLSGFSSKGPVTWQNVNPYNDFAYNPGIGLIRPDIVAPGSDILSLSHTNNSGYLTMSGTSMATPAVAGLMALMISKNPNISPEEISQILEETATSMSPSKSNSHGSGRVNAPAALEATSFAGVRYASHTIVEETGNQDGEINPGETILVSLTMENPTEELLEDVQVIVTQFSPYIELTDSVASFGTFIPGQLVEVEEAFRFVVADNIPGGQSVQFTLYASSAQDPETTWRSQIELPLRAPDLMLTGILIDDSDNGNGNGRLDPGETALIRFRIENKGQLSSQEGLVSLSIFDQFVQLEEAQIVLPAVAAQSEFFAEFQVTVHGAMVPGSMVAYTMTLESGAYEILQSEHLKVGMIVEDWLSGDFTQYEWAFSGQADWFIDESESVEGGFSARSGAIGHSAQTGLELELDVLSNDTISFYRKVSSENNYDFLEFYIDGVRIDRWSGERAWQRFSYPVEAGTRLFKWVYVKDHIVTAGQDAAWIDMIELPGIARTVAFAGFDDSSCGFEPYQLEGFAVHYSQLHWSSDGDGEFSDTEILNPLYTPGPMDYHRGFANLSLLAQTPGSDESTGDQMHLEILSVPALSLGDDLVLCRNHTLVLDAGQGHASYLWFDLSQEQTLMIDPADYPSEESLEVWVIVANNHGCTSFDEILITFDECLDATFPGQSDATLLVYPNPASDLIRISFQAPMAGMARAVIYDLNGRELYRGMQTPAEGHTEWEISVNQLPSGLYIVRVIMNDAQFENRLIIH